MGREQLLFPHERDSSGAAMLDKNGRQRWNGVFSCPIALPFAAERHPRDWHDSILDSRTYAGKCL